jgi:tetratricopeptide (TPR) repeat protein
MLPICFILISAFANALTLDERRVKIENIVNEELAEVTRLAEQQDNKKPETLLRISELYLEKARLWRETENDNYLAIPLEQRKNASKKAYFKKSTLFFNKANNSAEKVVKKFPNYSEIGEIYFILAYNYKELGQLKTSQEYFRKASQYSKNTKTHQKSKLALAEFYYNEKKYAEAIPFYESSLDSENKWWTKDAFNLSWCYYRVKNYDAAINLLKNVHPQNIIIEPVYKFKTKQKLLSLLRKKNYPYWDVQKSGAFVKEF